MYPVTLIRVSRNKKVIVELKNNDIYEGILRDCDLLMNMKLTEVYIKGDSGGFYANECNLTGSFIKNVRLKDDIFHIQKQLEKRTKKKNK